MASGGAQDGSSNRFRVVCFGDSITGELPGKRFTYQSQYLKFSDLLQLQLEARLGAADVINSGWAGDYTFKQGDRPGAVNRVQCDILDFHPDVAVVLIGGNDNPRTIEERKRTYDGLMYIVTNLQAAHIKVLLMQYHDPVVTPANETTAWRHLSLATPLIGDVAMATNVPVLDMRPVFRDASEKHSIEQLVNVVDGVHLAPRGELIYARAIFSRIEELGWLEQHV